MRYYWYIIKYFMQLCPMTILPRYVWLPYSVKASSQRLSVKR